MTNPKQYQVGYKKPPKAGQWKKGQSGNPSGKKAPKKAVASKPFLECLAAELSEPVEVTVQGKKKQIPFGNVFIKKLLHDLMAAPLKEKAKAVEIFAKLGVFDFQGVLDGEDPEYDCFTEEDRRIIAAITGDLGD